MLRVRAQFGGSPSQGSGSWSSLPGPQVHPSRDYHPSAGAASAGDQGKCQDRGRHFVISGCGWDESLLSSQPPAEPPLKSPHPQPPGPPQGSHGEQPRTLSSLPSIPPPFTPQEHHTPPPHLPGEASGKSQGMRSLVLPTTTILHQISQALLLVTSTGGFRHCGSKRKDRPLLI